MKKSFFFCAIQLFIVVFYCPAQKKAIYNMFLEEAVPANGTEVVFNAPVLRWPYQKGKQVKYDVQLSQRKTFDDSTTITAQALIGAIYNPHRLLATGNWYWHYRVAGKDWSPLLQFNIGTGALPMVSPTADKFLEGIPQDHPRILINGKNDRIANLIQTPDAAAILADASTALTNKILTEADAQPTTKGESEDQDKKINSDAIVGLGNQLYKMVLPLCQGYLLNHNNAYREKAIAIAMEVAHWDPKGVSGSRDFTDGMCMYNMALVYDTFYDALSQEQKNILQKAITERAAQFYKSWINSIESKVLSGHVWQLLLNEFVKTGIALYNHEPGAAKWLSYSYEIFLARSPVLGGIDGGWAEGAYYFQMNMEALIEIPAFIKQYTGFDFISLHPWYRNQADWMIYHFPPSSSADGYGDNTEELFEPPSSYAAFSGVMAKLTQNPKYAWYANQLIKQQKIIISQEPVLRWFRLKNTDQLTMPAVADTLHFAMGSLSKEAGVAALHTNPAHTKKDVMIAMRASPFGAYGHILADQNTFNILFGGKRLFYRTGYKVAMDDPHRIGWSKHTKSMNGVLINGQGQPYSAEAYGYFSRFLQGEQLAYMKGDAANAYQSDETKEDYGVTKFNRHIVLVKPGIIVIYDELESKEAANWSWLIHSLKSMKLDTVHNTFISTIEGAKGIGKLWSSQAFSWNITNKFEVPAVIYRNYAGMKTKKYEDTQWHLKATNKERNKNIRFLSVIQVGKDGTALPLKESAVNGVTKITIGDWQIEAALSYDLSPQLTIHSLSGTTAFTAYANEISFHGQLYKGDIKESSKLVEIVNGKVQFKEMGDELLAPIR